jgi:hypothetical protein
MLSPLWRPANVGLGITLGERGQQQQHQQQQQQQCDSLGKTSGLTNLGGLTSYSNTAKFLDGQINNSGNSHSINSGHDMAMGYGRLEIAVGKNGSASVHQSHQGRSPGAPSGGPQLQQLQHPFVSQKLALPAAARASSAAPDVHAHQHRDGGGGGGHLVSLSPQGPHVLPIPTVRGFSHPKRPADNNNSSNRLLDGGFPRIGEGRAQVAAQGDNHINSNSAHGISYGPVTTATRALVDVIAAPANEKERDHSMAMLDIPKLDAVVALPTGSPASLPAGSGGGGGPKPPQDQQWPAKAPVPAAPEAQKGDVPLLSSIDDQALREAAIQAGNDVQNMVFSNRCPGVAANRNRK